MTAPAWHGEPMPEHVETVDASGLMRNIAMHLRLCGPDCAAITRLGDAHRFAPYLAAILDDAARDMDATEERNGWAADREKRTGAAQTYSMPRAFASNAYWMARDLAGLPNQT